MRPGGGVGGLVGSFQMSDNFLARRSSHRPSEGLTGSLQLGLLQVGTVSDRQSSRMSAARTSFRIDSSSVAQLPPLVWDEDGRMLVMQVRVMHSLIL